MTGSILFPEALTAKQRATAIDHVRRLGDRLAKEGYKGFLEIDVLVDLADDSVYLGELNPRISGASSMTNVTAGAYADVPLFLFHLLEFMDVDYSIDVEEINERWRELAAVDVWAQLIMKEPDDSVEIVYFGLLPEFMGRRLGGHLLTEAVERAWGIGARRVWLHTCSFDHPFAILNYLSRGFTIYKTERYLVR